MPDSQYRVIENDALGLSTRGKLEVIWSPLIGLIRKQRRYPLPSNLHQPHRHGVAFFVVQVL